MILSETNLSRYVEAYRVLGKRVVLTQGSFDFIHIGHFKYLEKAKEQGDILIVGVDSDAKVARRKGPSRPVVGEDERLEMLLHVKHVDHVVLKSSSWPQWHLIKTIHPDVLVAVEGAYSEYDAGGPLLDHCGQLVVLPRQATTSTTAKLRRLLG